MKAIIKATVLLLTVSTINSFSIPTKGKSTSTTLFSSRKDFLEKSAVAAFGIASAIPRAAASNAADDDSDFITTESGLKYVVTKEGTGAIPDTGANVKAHYTGWLDGFDSIRKFDSSRDRGRPFTFRVGMGQVIRGWDESFSTMKVGERRKVIIPPRLGYGKHIFYCYDLSLSHNYITFVFTHR